MANELKLQAYQNKKKSKLVAYILWILFCFFGIHRFYLRRYFSGMIIAGFTIASIVIEMQNGEKAGNIIFLVPVVWSIFDLFFIPKMVRTLNVDIALELGLERVDEL
jgi:TM2 domain-containing membrane protein YozV